MRYNELTTLIKNSGHACYIFEQSGHRQYRDRLNVYYDGKILFERFCYGEAAGLVFDMWANGLDNENYIVWDYDTCKNSKKSEAPSAITQIEAEFLLIDSKDIKWNCVKTLKRDAKHGYGFIKTFFKK